MAILNDSSFPLLVSDQAEVIAIYLGLMHERVLGRSEFSATDPLGPLNDAGNSRSPRERSGME